jgi:DNA invertase Pin-like site-specific DNA recombinase
VSTVKQGEYGVSLPEQRDTIEHYASEIRLHIIEWFEDRETAAVRGRPAFNRMLRRLEAGGVTGIIFYKVDRSSRNSADWAEIDGLADRGFEVHFAHERLMLAKRGDRLTANIKAAVAADESRTIRDRVTMGFYGRVKQGLLPRPAPLGYLNNGGGQTKTLDPRTAPLVRTLFELYGTGRFSLRTMGVEATRIGLRSRKGKRLRRTQLAEVLHNPFYAGVIRIKKTAQTFPGVHQPLISSALFERVQHILKGKAPRHTVVHDFLFRRLLTCVHCGRHLIGELQKGRVYYRCQVPNCPTTTVREDAAEQHLRSLLQSLQFTDDYIAEFKAELVAQQRDTKSRALERAQARRLRLENVAARQTRLTDAWIDSAIDKADFEQRKTALLMERRELESVANVDVEPEGAEDLQHFLELANQADLLYEHALPHERRELIETLTSNRVVDGRTPRFTPSIPFRDLATAAKEQHGGPSRTTARTRSTVRRLLKQWRLKCVEPVMSGLAERVQHVLHRDDPTVDELPDLRIVE